MQANETRIHPTAIVSDRAALGERVLVGPYAVIEDDVTVGDDTVIGSHSVVHSYTRIGARNTLHAHVILGDVPQHSAFRPGTVSWLETGDDNDIREMVTVHRALYEGAATRIGSSCLIMTNGHIGHDCVIGDRVVITTNAALAGHVEIGECAIIGGLTGVHQFVRIGRYAMVAACSMVRKDLLPYSLSAGAGSAQHYRLNTVGLRRNGVTGERYRALEKAFRQIRDGSSPEREDTEETRFLRQWLAEPSKRGLAGFYRGKSARLPVDSQA